MDPAQQIAEIKKEIIAIASMHRKRRDGSQFGDPWGCTHEARPAIVAKLKSNRITQQRLKARKGSKLPASALAKIDKTLAAFEGVEIRNQGMWFDALAASIACSEALDKRLAEAAARGEKVTVCDARTWKK